MRGFFAFSVGIFFCAEVYLMGGGVWLTLVCAMIFFGYLGAFFWPTFYKACKRELVVKFPLKGEKHFSWEDFKSFYEKKSRVYLFREADPPVLVTSRALALEFSEDSGEIKERIIKHLKNRKFVPLHTRRQK